jgi:hypothetical protein
VTAKAYRRREFALTVFLQIAGVKTREFPTASVAETVEE